MRLLLFAAKIAKKKTELAAKNAKKNKLVILDPESRIPNPESRIPNPESCL